MELDVSDFKKPARTDPAELRSVEAPARPFVLIDQEAQDGQVFPPGTELTVVTQEPVIPPAPLTPMPLRGIDMSKVETRSDLIKALAQNLPQNEYNLPIHLYRADLLDVAVIQDQILGSPVVVEEMLASALIQVDYSQGFPSLGGNPLWAQLPYESREAYAAFLEYCDLPGTRSLHALTAYSIDLLNEHFHMNYWRTRATAYDMFRAAHHQRMREQRIMSVEGSHYVESEKIFSRLTKAIGNKTDDELKDMDLDKLVNALDKVAKIQRAAVGLGPSGNEDKPIRPTTVEVAFRQAAQVDGPKVSHSDDVDMAALLNDPKALQNAQELILKVQTR